MKDTPTVTAFPAPVPGLWVVRCPHCSKQHVHGGVPGHRQPDCPPGTPGKDVGYVAVMARATA